MPDLNITIGADLGSTVQKIEGVNKGLKNLSDTAVKTSTSLTKLSGSSNSAGFALQNVGRVAQDLPFGFIGIQNNLNPLLESFQRLKVETGSSSLALKALGSSLIGAGGIGLALSLVSGAILIFQNGIAGFNKKTKEAADTSKDFANALKEAEASAVSAGFKLQNFVDIARDSTQSLATRNEALLQANKLMGDHGEKLTLVNIATAAVTEQINKYTQATIQQALATKFTDRATDLIIKQMDAISEHTQAVIKLNEISKQPGPLSTTSATGEDRITKKGALIAKQTIQVQELAKAYSAVTKELSGVEGRLGTAQLQAADLFGELGHKTKPIKPEKAKEIKEELVKALKFGQEDLSKLFFDEAGVKLQVPASIELDFKKSLRKQDALGGLSGVLSPEALQEINMKAELIGMGITEGIQDGIMVGIEGLRFPQLKALFDSARQRAAEFRVFASELFTNVAIDSFSKLGESIGDALTGAKDPIGSFFGGIASLLAQSLKDLGKYIIATSTVVASIKKALNAAFAGNPALGIGVGIALIAIGTALQNAIPKFAAGVKNFAGGLAIVGERGPELVRLPRGSDVIPNNRLNSLDAGGTQVFIPDIRLRGSDLVIAFNRASQTISRNG